VAVILQESAMVAVRFAVAAAHPRRWQTIAIGLANAFRPTILHLANFVLAALNSLASFSTRLAIGRAAEKRVVAEESAGIEIIGAVSQRGTGSSHGAAVLLSDESAHQALTATILANHLPAVSRLNRCKQG